MKKRRRPAPQPDESRPDLAKFHDDVGGGGGAGDEGVDGGGVGGGMSRAAKKRAKKRARAAASSSSPAAPTAKDDNDGARTRVAWDDGENDREDGEGTGDGGEMDLRDAVRRFRKENGGGKKMTKEEKSGDGGKKKKRKKKKEKEEGADGKISEAANEAEGEGDASDEDEMDPGLEALLSTLTPRQILLLDANDDDDDGDGEEEKNPSSEGNDAADDSGSLNGRGEGTEAPRSGGAVDPLAFVDPLRLIPDLTTEHRARILLSSLIGPAGVSVREFYEAHWGKRPLLARRAPPGEGEDGGGRTAADEAAAARHAARFDGFLDRASIDAMIRRNKLRYGLDLNVTRYADATGDGVRRRITLDPPPKRRTRRKGDGGDDDDDLEHVVADPADVWSNVDDVGCTLRLLRPHEHDDSLHALLSLLESEFGCMTGANAYLTPKGAQGFAPHYDDVDVFVMQLEGYKRWRVCAPFGKGETLPRESSRDYTDDEVEERGEEVLDVVLGPGDVLYLPRGWIHRAETVARPPGIAKGARRDDGHSLHLTASAMQAWSWADFLEVLLPGALEAAASSDRDVVLREGLPRNFLSYMGAVHRDPTEEGDGALPEGLRQAAEAWAAEDGGAEGEEEDGEEARAQRRRTAALRNRFRDEAARRVARVSRRALAMLDDACDRIGTRFLSDRLPPALLPPERRLTKDGRGDGDAASRKIWPNTLCRLVRPGIARLVVEGDKAVLYHCLDNSRVHRETPLSPLEFEVDDAPALEQLLTTVEPRWIMVRDLIHEDVEEKMGIAQSLYDEGVLATMLAGTPDRSVQTG